jgi:hypothetical protein
VTAECGTVKNDWPVWIFPAKFGEDGIRVPVSSVMVTDTLNTAVLDALENGARVGVTHLNSEEKGGRSGRIPEE